MSFPKLTQTYLIGWNHVSPLAVVTVSPRVSLLLNQVPYWQHKVCPSIMRNERLSYFSESSTWRKSDRIRKAWTHNLDMMISSHSPVTINQLQDLSMISKFQKFAPALCKFFQLVGDTSRNTSVDQSDLPVEETKALVPACALVNARSHRFKGCYCQMPELLTNRYITHYSNKHALNFESSHRVSIVSI